MIEISSTTNDTHYSLIEDVSDDVSSWDEIIDQMEGVLINKYMEQENEDHGKMKSTEVIIEDPLMEQVQYSCMEYYELENNEVEFPLCK